MNDATSTTASPRRAGWRRWLPEFLVLPERRIRGQVRMLGLATLVGLVAGVAAIGFYLATQAASVGTLGAIAGFRQDPPPAGEAQLGWLPAPAAALRPWLLILIPTVGGLLCGVLVYTLAPEAEGHGTDSVIAAYHRQQGYMRPRVPLVKLVASAITLGSGGSGGREGPIAQIGAGFGSMLAGALRLPVAERRVLLAAGMGAGIAAIFRAPLAGALFAAEVLYSSPEFEADVILPAALASVIAYSTFGAAFGWDPLFATPALTFDNPLQLFPYTALAVCMAALAMIYTRTFYGLTALFRRVPLPRHVRPALGGLATGAVGLAIYYALGRDERALAVFSFGYGAIQGALDSANYGAWLLLAIALGKLVTTSLTIGSGGSGGVFGPSMVIGGCAGGALGLALHDLLPSLVPQPATFVVVGMAGFFAAAAKTPFSTLIMVSEMTGGYHLLLPALWVCTISFMISDEQSIYSAQVFGRSRSGAHRGGFMPEVLASLQVAELILPATQCPALKADAALPLVLQQFDETAAAVLPIVDAAGRLLGVVALEEVYLASQSHDPQGLILAVDLMRGDVAPLVSSDSLERAVEAFVEHDLPALPVVSADNERRLLGMVRRVDVARRYFSLLHSPLTADTET